MSSLRNNQQAKTMLTSPQGQLIVSSSFCLFLSAARILFYYGTVLFLKLFSRRLVPSAMVRNLHLEGRWEGFTSWNKFYARFRIWGTASVPTPWLRFRLSCLLLSNTSVTSNLQNVTWHHQYMSTKWAHIVSPWQQPEDKQFLLMRFPPMSECKVKENPWCLSVNWAYYVSASGCKGRKEGRKEWKTGFLSLQRRQMSQSYFH